MSTPRDPLAVYPGMSPAERAEVRERRAVDAAARLERAKAHAAEHEVTPEERASTERALAGLGAFLSGVPATMHEPIPCAFCGAAADAPCTNADGLPLEGLHVSRFGRGPRTLNTTTPRSP